MKGIIFRSCPLLALVAGGAPRDDEGADLVGMLPSNNEEVGDVPDGEIEGVAGSIARSPETIARSVAPW